MDQGFLAQLEMNRSAKPYSKQFMEIIGLDKTLDYYTYKLLKVNMAISEAKKAEYKACKVYVIFNEEHSQRRCLEHMCVGLVPAMLDQKPPAFDDKYLFKGNLLSIKEAPEPSSIIYQNLESSLFQHLFEQAVSWTLLVVGLICTYFSVVGSFNDGQPIVGALLISFWNSVLPIMNKVLVTTFESHHDQEGVENSFIQKTVTARGFVSALILYLVGLSHSPQMLSPYFMGSIQAVLLADAITTPIARALDVGGRVKRFFLAARAATDDKAKLLVQGADYLLAERYTDMAKTVLMSMWFSAIFPMGFFYSAFACFCSFWADKYCILRIYRQKPPSGDKLVRITRTFAACIILVHSVITSHAYYSWPYDNLCKTSDELSPAGQTRAALLGIETPVAYRQCNSVSDSFLPPVSQGREDWFQEGNEQIRLVFFYNIVAIITICYITTVYFGSSTHGLIYGLFYYKHDAVGDATDIKYETVDSGEGYVPQVQVPFLDHSVLACSAPGQANEGGGLEFDTYLLNWTASKERTGEESPEETFVDLTEAEKDAVYRRYNFFFDDQFEGMDKSKLFSRAKQYIHNTETQEAGAFRMSVAGRARASIIKKEGGLAKSGMMRVTGAMSSGLKTAGSFQMTSLLKKKPEAASESSWAASQAAAAAAAGTGGQADIGDAVFAKPADASGLEAMAEADERRETTEVEFPSSMSGGTYT